MKSNGIGGERGDFFCVFFSHTGFRALETDNLQRDHATTCTRRRPKFSSLSPLILNFVSVPVSETQFIGAHVSHDDGVARLSLSPRH